MVCQESSYSLSHFSAVHVFYETPPDRIFLFAVSFGGRGDHFLFYYIKPRQVMGRMPPGEPSLFFLGNVFGFLSGPACHIQGIPACSPRFLADDRFYSGIAFPLQAFRNNQNSFLAYDSDRSRGDMASPRPVSGAPSNRQMEHSEGFFLPLCFSLYHTGNLPVSECGECFGAETAHSGFRDFLPQVSDPSHLFSVDRRGAETFSAESVPDPCRWTVVSPTRPSRSRCNPFRPPPDPDTAAAKH